MVLVHRAQKLILYPYITLIKDVLTIIRKWTNNNVLATCNTQDIINQLIRRAASAYGGV